MILRHGKICNKIVRHGDIKLIRTGDANLIINFTSPKATFFGPLSSQRSSLYMNYKGSLKILINMVIKLILLINGQEMTELLLMI